MKLHLSLLFVVCTPFVGSCLQKDPGQQQPQQPQAPPDASIPSTQCSNESSECFSLCGSPECAMPDNSIPPVLDIPLIWYQPSGETAGYGSAAPGKSTTDPCVAIQAASLVIRQRSCAPCHGPSPSPGLGRFNYVLDDVTLANHSDNEQDGKIMVIPGDPASSYAYQRAVTGLAGAGSGGMPPDPSTLPAYLGAAAVQANPNIVVYPTAADLSVLYAWILGCMPGADAGVYQSSYGSGSFGSNAAPNTGVAASN
jgi:hypothetical protein